MFDHFIGLLKRIVVCFGCNKEGHIISRGPNHEKIAGGGAARVQHMQRIMRIAPQQVTMLELNAMFQPLAEAKRKELEYKLLSHSLQMKEKFSSIQEDVVKLLINQEMSLILHILLSIK